MKKICFVTTISGSIDAFIYPCVPMLQKMGFSITFATTCKEGFQEKCEKEGVQVYDIPVGRGFDFRGMAIAVKKFYKICKKEKFDIVFYATPNASLYASVAAKLAKIPCRVLAQWGMRYVGYTGFKRKFMCWLEKIACMNSTDIRAVSEKNRALAIADKMYRPNKCKVLGKGGTIGVDLDLYPKEMIPSMRQQTREKLEIPENAITYGFVGRICRDKGVGELFAAFEKVQKKNANTYLMLLGSLDDNAMLEEELLNRAKENPHIIFCGRVPRAEVSTYLAGADVLVHPTYREGFGMVLQEAAAMYLPTVTTNIPGASEAIVDGETGLLAEKQDVDSLADAMVKLFDETLRQEFGVNGRKRIESDFDRNMRIELLCKDYQELYEKRVKK